MATELVKAGMFEAEMFEGHSESLDKNSSEILQADNEVTPSKGITSPNRAGVAEPFSKSGTKTVDGQTDRRTDRQTDGQKNIQTDKNRYRVAPQLKTLRGKKLAFQVSLYCRDFFFSLIIPIVIHIFKVECELNCELYCIRI